MCPETLRDLLPPTTDERTQYSLRSGSNTTLVKTRTQTLQDSFFPKTIRMWNELSAGKKAATSVGQFKENIKPEKSRIPQYVYEGERKLQIPHTRMRLRNSDLNEDLYIINLTETPECACGYGVEDYEHFLKDCIRYNNIRRRVWEKFYIDFQPYEVEELLEGDHNKDDDENRLLFQAVQWYIGETRRFR